MPDEELAAIKQELPIHADLTRQEPGCLVFEINSDENNKHRFNVYEEFESRDAFDYHQERVKNSAWGMITTNIERHYKIYE